MTTNTNVPAATRNANTRTAAAAVIVERAEAAWAKIWRGAHWSADAADTSRAAAAATAAAANAAGYKLGEVARALACRQMLEAAVKAASSAASNAAAHRAWLAYTQHAWKQPDHDIAAATAAAVTAAAVAAEAAATAAAEAAAAGDVGEVARAWAVATDFAAAAAEGYTL